MDVAAAGDVNGDGFDDVIVTGDGSKAAYVIFGHDGAWPGIIDANTLDGTDGFRLDGAGAVGDAGDVNGDGFDDLIVTESNAAVSHVVYGRDTSWEASYTLSEMESATSVPGALTVIGDVNGDGFDDLAASDPTADPHGIINGGSTGVIFGSDILDDEDMVDLAGLDGGNGFRVDGSTLGADAAGRGGRCER